MSDPVVRHLARELSAMQDRIRAMEVASQAAFRSIEGGSIDVYDDETDELLGVIGQQKDGSIGVNIKTGKKPEAPTEPDVQPIPGGAIVAWDGRFEERQSALVIDRVAVHMDETAGFTPDRDSEVAAIRSTGSGGTAVIPIDDGTDWYVKLVAVSKGGVWSDPSDEVHVAAVDAETAFFHDEWVLTAGGGQTRTLTYEPLPGSEHIYWNGVHQQEDIAWTRDGRTLTLVDATGLLAANHTITAKYAYSPLDNDIAATLVASSNGNGTLTVPAGTQVGDVIVFAVAVPSGSSTTLNGYTALATTANVTHAGASGTFTYKLSVVGWTEDGTHKVPSFSAVSADRVWTCAVFRGPKLAATDSAVATVADSKNGSAPGLTGADLRAFATIGNNPAISLVDDGQVVTSRNAGADVDLLIASDGGAGPLQAQTAPASAGWMLATISLGA